jgi:hypothetical protein
MTISSTITSDQGLYRPGAGPARLPRSEAGLRVATALIAAVCSASGLVNPDQYRAVVSLAVMPGALGQDAMALALSILLLVTTIVGRPFDRLALPALAFLAYGYGIYAIERTVTHWYLAYLAALACAAWALLLGAVRSVRVSTESEPVRGPRRVLVAALCGLTAIAFSTAWVAALAPFVRSSTQPTELWSVYLIDLCFVMPACATAAWWIWRRDARGGALGTLMTGLGAVMMASLSLAEVCGPLVGLAAEPAAALPTLALTAVFATGWVVLRPSPTPDLSV